jgi:hypothetical protein
VVAVCEEGTPIDRLARLTIAVAVGAAVFALGCTGMAWKKALRTDSAAGYYRYIRDHPKSSYIGAAEERIAFHKVLRRPDLNAYHRFQTEYPESALLPKLRVAIEELAFEAAMAAGTADAYQRFQKDFADGIHVRRAAGNAAYLAANGFGHRPSELQTFAATHPESDFAAEALRSLEALEARSQTRFQRVGLEIKINRGTPEGKRIAKAFGDRAVKAYRDAGMELVPARRGVKLPEMRLTIQHGEKLESAEVKGGEVSRAGVVARTRVTLRRGAKGPVVWSRDFQVRVLPHQRIADASLLFASEPAKLYWEKFFVPVATWESRAAVRPALQLTDTVVAVDADQSRAVVLYGDGDFQLWGLSDPQAPTLLAEYDRASEIEHFGGVRLVDDEVVLYGQDGLEIVHFGPEGPKAVVTRSRGEVGSIRALQPVREGLLLASSQGLLLADRRGGNAKRVMRRMILGIAALGDKLVLADGDIVFVSTVELLRQQRVMAKLRLGREFKPAHVRVADGHAVVMGDGGIVVLGIPRSGKPRVVAKLNRSSSGEVRDALSMAGRIFLVGSRGVQLLDADRTRVAEAVDVVPRQFIARSGRHLVLAGEDHLQVVDVLPFTGLPPLPARPAQ